MAFHSHEWVYLQNALEIICKETKAFGLNSPEAERIVRTAPVDGQGNMQFQTSEQIGRLSEKDLSLLKNPAILNRLRRYWLIQYLADPATPYHTVNELGDIAAAYADHFKRQRDPLIETGYPNSTFELSHWFDWHFTPLSFVKIPISLYEKSPDYPYPHPSDIYLRPSSCHTFKDRGWLKKDAAGNCCHSYFWSPETLPVEWTKSAEGSGKLIRQDWRIRHSGSLATCSYDDAARIVDLPKEMVERLENDRESLFRLKHKIINVCVQCLRSRIHKNLWPAVAKLLSGYEGEPLPLYFEVDAKLLGLNICSEIVAWEYEISALSDDFIFPVRPVPLITGGLCDLLTAVGYVEKEIQHRTMDQVKTDIAKAIQKWGPVENDYRRFENPAKDELFRAIDTYWDLERQTWSFWPSYQQRVNKFLVDECDLPNNLVFEPHPRTYADWSSAGPGSKFYVTPNVDSPTPDKSVFEHSPDYSWVRLRGQGYNLTPPQRSVVEILHSEYKANGKGIVGQAYILDKAGYKAKSLRDVFRNSAAWKTLIVSGEKKGTYRLKI